MAKIAVVLLALAAVAAGLSKSSPAAHGELCGLPDSHPLWLDYAEASVSFRNEVFAHSGVIAATSGTTVAADLRAGGAQTVYWWMKLNRLAGTPANPTDQATVASGIDEVFTKAVAATECDTPLIVLNELNGAGTTTPWTDSNARYRANVLAVLQGLAAHGARPLLLLSARPYTGGDAGQWWLEASRAADLVREVYFPAPPVMRSGAIVGSRTMRQRFRDGVAPLRAIGIPFERLGIVIGFQSGAGKGGREGLQPRSAWLRFVKLQTLAAKQVASELDLGWVVSWGWGTFNEAGADADKASAACVYLWARDQGLCDGRAAAGTGFASSLVEGQITLPGGARCVVDGTTIATADVTSLARVTGDSGVALSALFARLVESPGHPVSLDAIAGLERSIIAVRFHGSRAAYEARLRARRASVSLARSIIADQLRRQTIGRKLRVAQPTPGQIATFYALYGQLPVREVRADGTPSWLGGRRRGFTLVPPGPVQLLVAPTALKARLVTGTGPIAVTPLDETMPLGAVPLGAVRGAVRAALTAQARARAFESWSVRAQGRALSRALCTGDVLPAGATVDLASYLPFLALDA